MARAIALKTYKSFMKKYKLKLMNKDEEDNYVYKSMKQMSSEIYNYETTNKIKVGLYYY
jgi:hypothetical protein